MIHDWKTLTDRPAATGPIGDPFTANRTYMSIFVALECQALQRCTDAELAAWDRSPFGISLDAYYERLRRAELDA
jgi:hypothetical protein